MKQSRKTSVALSDDELAILDATAARLRISRSEVVRHLLLYQGLCGGDFPLTTRILRLPEDQRAHVVREIRAHAESGTSAKPQAFRQWVKESIGSDDAAAMERSTDSLLRRLLA